MSLSGFIARHIEQPAARHSKPASLKISCRPSASATLATCFDPGTTSALTPLATLRLGAFALKANLKDGVGPGSAVQAARPLERLPPVSVPMFGFWVGWLGEGRRAVARRPGGLRPFRTETI